MIQDGWHSEEMKGIELSMAVNDGLEKQVTEREEQAVMLIQSVL